MGRGEEGGEMSFGGAEGRALHIDLSWEIKGENVEEKLDGEWSGNSICLIKARWAEGENGLLVHLWVSWRGRL